MKQYAFGPGTVTCDDTDGSVIRVEHPQHPGMTFLLDERHAEWHQSPFYWARAFWSPTSAAAAGATRGS